MQILVFILYFALAVFQCATIFSVFNQSLGLHWALAVAIAWVLGALPLIGTAGRHARGSYRVGLVVVGCPGVFGGAVVLIVATMAHSGLIRRAA